MKEELLKKIEQKKITAGGGKANAGISSRAWLCRASARGGESKSRISNDRI